MPGAEPRRIGKAAELRLADYLRRRGWSVIRAPASGARSKQPLPDIVAMKGGRILVLEVKYRETPRSIYIEEEKYIGIKEYAENAGAEAYLVVKIRGEEGYRAVEWSRAEKQVLSNGAWYVFYKHVIDRAKSLDTVLDGHSAE